MYSFFSPHTGHYTWDTISDVTCNTKSMQAICHAIKGERHVDSNAVSPPCQTQVTFEVGKGSDLRYNVVLYLDKQGILILGRINLAAVTTIKVANKIPQIKRLRKVDSLLLFWFDFYSAWHELQLPDFGLVSFHLCEKLYKNRGFASTIYKKKSYRRKMVGGGFPQEGGNLLRRKATTSPWGNILIQRYKLVLNSWSSPISAKWVHHNCYYYHKY